MKIFSTNFQFKFHHNWCDSLARTSFFTLAVDDDFFFSLSFSSFGIFDAVSTVQQKRKFQIFKLFAFPILFVGLVLLC